MMIIEKINDEKGGTFKDAVSGDVMVYDEMKKELDNFYAMRGKFNKIDYPKGATAEVMAAIDYYNANKIEMDNIAVENNIIFYKDMVSRMEQIILKEK